MIKKASSMDSSRNPQLDKDFQEMTQLMELNSGKLRIKRVGCEDNHPCHYLIEAHLKIITKIDQVGIPVFSDNFVINLFLPNGYPEKKTPQMRIRPTPFNPFIQANSIVPYFFDNNIGKWIDPREKYSSLANYFLRIINNLCYKDIELNPVIIANRKAFLWYLNWESFFRVNNKTAFFPTDSIMSPNHNVIKANINNKIETETEQNQISKFQNTPFSKKEFSIISSKPGYEPEQGKKPYFVSLFSSNTCSRESRNILYIPLHAFLKISEHIEWERCNERNSNEQGGLLLGRVIKDKNNYLYGLVEEVIPAELTNSSSSYLSMGFETWKKMIEKTDLYLDKRKGSQDINIIGWYHTHPNNLDVFMSSTDVQTQSVVFQKEWQFAVVLNPQRRRFRVFNGVQSSECIGNVGYFNREDLEGNNSNLIY